jgi:hypothetical protein
MPIELDFKYNYFFFVVARHGVPLLSARKMPLVLVKLATNSPVDV